MIAWMRAKPEPIRYPGIGVPLVKLKPDTLLRTHEDVQTAIDMMWQGGTK